jgi:two-component system CheB/CheR fusion protein
VKWDLAGRFSESNFSEVSEFSRIPDHDNIERGKAPVVFVVDDDHFSRSSLRMMLEDAGLAVKEFCDCETFLADYSPRTEACLVLDVHFPGMGGIELLTRLNAISTSLPTIIISGSSKVPEIVQSMKVGAADFIEKPIPHEILVTGVRKALEQSRRLNSACYLKEVALDHLADLTPRQRQIMHLVLAGHPSKNIAADLGISQRTVENHRASIMHKTGAKSLPALARLAIAASPYRPGALGDDR